MRHMATLGGWLIACGPPIAGPPPVPLAQNESMQIASYATYVDTVGKSRPRPPAGDLFQTQLAATFRMKNQAFHLTPLVSFGGKRSFWGAGILGRYQIMSERTDLWQVQSSIGIGWADLGISWTREKERLAIYSAPSIGLRDSIWMRVPIGIRVDLDGYYLDLESGLTTSTAMLDPDRAYGPSSYGYVSLGLSKGFPVKETQNSK